MSRKEIRGTIALVIDRKQVSVHHNKNDPRLSCIIKHWDFFWKDYTFLKIFGSTLFNYIFYSIFIVYQRVESNFRVDKYTVTRA